MTTQSQYRLTQQERALLEEAVAIALRPLVRQRAQALLLLQEGFTPGQVAEVLRVHVKTVYSWCQRWREEGTRALHDRPRSGRPPKSDARYRQLLEQALAYDPDQLGFDFITWTVERLRIYMHQQTSIFLSDRRMRALLRRLGYTYTIYRHARPIPNLPPRQEPPRTLREQLVVLLFSERVQWVFTWKKA